jgi:hypothetical protein
MKLEQKKIEQAKIQWEKLSDRVRSVLLGTVVGDASVGIYKGYANARVQFRHSEKQTEYFNWKRDILRSEISVDRVAHIENKDTMYQQVTNPKEYGTAKWRYQSQALASLTYLYSMVYENGNGVKVVKRSTLNAMTALSLAVWWQDDGSLVSGQRQGVLCTDGYTEGEVKTIKQYLQVVWGVGTKAYIVREGGAPKLKVDGAERWRLRMATLGDLEKFLLTIMPHVEVGIMLKKILIKYPDAERQQRWTSEIIARTKFTQAEVNKALSQKMI